MPYGYLIVDDERLNREYIRDLIAEFDPGAEIREADGAMEALILIKDRCPDILFLDIRMPEVSGFDLLELLPGINFELIFITAYSEYAIQAIKSGAVDYLLKPIRKSDFRVTLERVKALRKERLELLQRAGEQDRYLHQKLLINQQQGKQLIPLHDVLYLKADNTYTTIFLSNGQKITTSRPINRYEDVLAEPWFFRIHKSYIIGLAHFKEYHAKDTGVAVMGNGERLPISRYRLGAFLNLIHHMTHILKP